MASKDINRNMGKEVERMNYQTCTKCGETLPATPEYFHRAKSCKFGIKGSCKKCQSRISRTRYYEYYHKIRKSMRGDLEKRMKDSKLRRLHERIRKKMGEPQFCTICNLPKKLDVCSIDHKYTESLEDWIYLCRSCHILFDSLRIVAEA